MKHPFQLLLGVFLSLTVACQPAAPTPSKGPRVVAAESFLADIAQNVAGDRLTVESLLPAGVDPHEFQLAPQDGVRLAQADLLIVNGLGYESWLKQSLEANLSARVIVEAAAGVTPSVEGDPHQWMDPRNVVTYARNIRGALTNVDPAGATVFEANAAAYIATLTELDESIRVQVAALPADRRVLVTNHDALRSFADAYGFEIAGVVVPGFSSEGAPSARQIASLIETIRSSGIPAVFLDISENQDLARQIASETGARVVTDLYVETLSDVGGPAPTYLEMIRHDMRRIVEALQ